METSARTRAALTDAVLGHVKAVAGARWASLSRNALAAFDPSDPRRMLDVAAIASLLEGAARSLEDDAIGLHLATEFELGALGPFSYAVLHAPTLGTALRNVERYSDAVAVGARLRLALDGPGAGLCFPAWEGDPGAARQLDEAAVLVFLRMLRRMVGPDWSPRGIDFRHPAPSSLAEHRRLLAAPLRFGQSTCRIRFAEGDLERPVFGADRFLLPIVERHLQDVVSDDAASDPWHHELELQVASLVCDGHPGMRAIAPRLGLSVRTLQRRLEEHGLCYRDLVAGVRAQLARHYLRERGPSLGEIAFLLGYSELSAFDRAFRRWQGTSPGEYRRRVALLD